MKNKSSVLSIIIIFFFAFASISYSGSGDPKEWKYFRINSSANDELFFEKIKGELGIKNTEKEYSLLVNVSDPIPQNQYIELINRNSDTKKRYSWYELSELTQTEILDWSGTGKENLSDETDTKLTYFRIHARSTDDPLFVNIQKELLKNEKLLETYTIVVNVSNTNPLKHYVVFGNEDVRDPLKFAWSELSMDTQKGLLDWSGANKFKVE